MNDDPKSGEPIATALAIDIPPCELTPKEALELYSKIAAREMSDADFDGMIRAYREKRRQDAARRLERDRAKIEREAKRAAAAAKKALKAAPKIEGGGEGGN